MVRDAGERERRRRNEERGSRQLKGREGGGGGGKEGYPDVHSISVSGYSDNPEQGSCLGPLSPKILDNLRLFGAVEHAAYSGGLVGWRKREEELEGRERRVCWEGRNGAC